MKKAFTAIAALALTIGVASALSFSWGTNTKISFNGTVLDTAELAAPLTAELIFAAPLTAELIFLGKDNAWSFDESGLVTDEAVSTGSIAVSGAPTGKGKGNGKIDKPLVGTSFADGSKFGNGNVFGVLITYTDTKGVVWYNLSSNTFTLSGVADETSPIDKQYFDFVWTNDESGGDTPTAGGGWWMVPVPEPMTVLCGLAGLALLLKRRA